MSIEKFLDTVYQNNKPGAKKTITPGTQGVALRRTKRGIFSQLFRLRPSYWLRRTRLSNKLYYYTIIIVIFAVFGSTALWQLTHPTGSKAAWPPAHRASGSESLTRTGSASSPEGLLARRESLMSYYFFLGSYFVYLLRSEKDHLYYVGQTSNVQSRVKLHNAGQVISTRMRRPWKLVGFETYQSRSESMWREHQLKHRAVLKKVFIEELEGKHA